MSRWLVGSSSISRLPSSIRACASETFFAIPPESSPILVDGRIERINTAYINTALQDISGIDANYRYRLNTDRWGTFRFEANYSITMTNKYKEFPEDDLIDYRDLPPEYFYPERSRARASVSWDKSDWSSTIYVTRMGSAWSAQERDGCFTGANSHVCYGTKLAPFLSWNAQVGKRFGENILAQFTMVNVFNKQYRYDPGQSGYPYYNPWVGADPLGRRFYLSVNYSF